VTGERDFYEELLPLAARQLSALRDAKEDELARLEIESVEVAEDDDNGVHVAVLFRDPARPGRRFGWRWSWTDRPKPDEVAFAAGVLAVNLEEDIVSEQYGLPEVCADDGVTWF
jgi:hypothetical protein